MLMEFTLAASIAEKKTPQRSAFILMNQIVAVHEPPAFMRDDDSPIRRCEVSLRSGQRFEVLESVDDVLDAMKFASRHIGVTPGIADKLDGETGEEIFPWRRAEKVTELARKWREHEKGKANSGKAPPPLRIPPGVTKEGVRVDPDFLPRTGPSWPRCAPPSAQPSPTPSSEEAPTAGSATPEPTSEPSPPEAPTPGE